MRFALRSLLFVIFLLAISVKGISQQNGFMQAHNRTSDPGLRIQQLLPFGPAFANQNQKPAVGFSPSSSFRKQVFPGFNRLSQTEAGTGCSDTSARFFLKDVAGGSFYIGDYIRARDGYILIAGQYVINNAGNLISKGFLMKCDENGNIFWNRIYQNANSANTNDFIFYYKLIELENGNILMTGSTLDYVTQNNDLIITTTDNAGNLTWSKIYKSRLWAYGYQSSNYYYVQQIIQDKASGNVFIAGRHWTEGRSIINLNPSNGNILWSKLYQPSDGGHIDDPFGMDIQNNELLIFGHFLIADGARISVYRLNKSTGDTIKSRFYKISGNVADKNRFVGINPLVKLNNGNYALTGEQYGYNTVAGVTEPPYHAGYIQLDKDLNFVTAYSFRNETPGNSSNTMLSVFPDGSGLFTMHQYVSAYTAPVFYLQFKNGKILNQRIRFYSGESVPNEHPALELTDGGTLAIKLIGDSVSDDTKVEFLKLHTNDSSSQCLGITNNSTFIEPFYLEDTPGYIDSVGTNVFQENTNKEIFTTTTNLTYSPACQQISFCDSIAISSSSKSLCSSDSLIITVHTNPECSGSVFFTVDSSRLQSITGINDSAYLFKFTSSWQGTIYANLRGCSNLMDSLQIISPTIRYASDTGFCTGSNVLLNAGPGFSSYEWSNGSTQQSISVSTIGDYSVKAITADGCTATDTIQVKEFDAPHSTLDKNSTLCMNEVRILDAGIFSSYKWNTGDTSRTIEISDKGIYYVTIKDQHGCTATDSTNIQYIAPLPSGFLPPDTTICNYRPTVLTPSKDYVSYLWYNEATTKSISVFQPGTYWLQVTDNNNCKGTDTIVLNAGNCADGFFIPNAFTPNNDGKNDDFKPFIFGPADHYEFIIYNREGEVVFKSHTVNEGWDGNFKGIPQASNLFVWICKYRFNGQTDKVQKGTVMLLR